MTKRLNLRFMLFGMMLTATQLLSAQSFKINADGCFNAAGVDVMAFSDFYPEGHQGGVCVIMNGRRVATNGDIRMEPTPGQWQPVPKQVSRKVEGNPRAKAYLLLLIWISLCLTICWVK